MKTFKRLSDDSVMPWGKHQGKTLENVPADYLFWLEEKNISKESTNNFISGLLVYINENRDALELEIK